MDLHEFLKKREEFQETYDFSQHSIEDIIGVVGARITRQMKDFFESEESTIRWFYTPLYNLKTSPHDYCVKNGTEEVERIIGLYESGDFGAI